MDAALRAGVAVYNAGYHHAAHDPWEAEWLDRDDGTPDERFLHGLIQFTAAVYHARTHNWSGAGGLAGSARDYLDGLGPSHRGLDLTAVRSYLRRLGADPETAERAPPPSLVHEGRALTLDDLDAVAAFHAAPAIAASDERFDADAVAAAVTRARSELDERGDGPYLALVLDFVRGDRRPTVHQRLAARVERSRQRDRDVDGLFD